ncbi:unnamed protein product [Rhodiola kirilowii]
MDPFGFNHAAPFPVPATGINLEFPDETAVIHFDQNYLHPPYPEMIKAAIAALNDASGSSKDAISRYIEETYSNLPPTHSEELAAWLQALTSNRELLQMRNCYTLPGFTLLAPVFAPAAPSGASAHRKRGRPRKLKPTTEPYFERSLESVNKANEANDFQVEAVAVVQEKRPERQVKKNEAEGSNGDFEKRRGRPKKSTKAVLSEPSGYPKRGPGRPPKSRSVADVSNGPVKTLAVTGVNTRGRPKRSVGNGQEPEVPKTIGWRPMQVRNNEEVGSRVLGPVSPQWMVDYAHVRARIGYIQSKMKKAIGVIKPHLMNQIITNGHVGTALQELDQISTMDVMAVSLADPDIEPEPTEET